MWANPKTCEEVGWEGEQGCKMQSGTAQPQNLKYFTMILPGDLTGQTGSPPNLGTLQGKSACDLLSPPAFPNLVSI